MVKSARQHVAPITQVKELHDNRSDWRIRVRLCRKWVMPQHGKTPPTLELLFVDAKGDRIQASIKAHLFETFQKYLKENAIFVVSHFSVVENKGNFPVTDHRYKIWFHTDTLIVETISLSFPLSVYKFKSFSDIKALGHSDDNPLFDVIGHVANDGERCVQEGSVGGKHNVEVMLEDLEKNKISLTLWEPYAKEFQDAYNHKSDGYFAVIVQLCRTKEFRGEIGLSNTYHATKLIFKEDEVQIDDYKQRLPPLQENSSQVLSQRSESSFKGMADDVENLADLTVPVLSLQQIKELKFTGKFWVVATISEVIANKGWFYNSCSKCCKKVVEADEKFYCEKCHKHLVEVPRFKVHVRVVDGFSLEFLLFDHVASILLTGNNTGQRVFIPRLMLTTSDARLPFRFQRRQFPLIVSYAMMINKSQGQSLSNVGIFLKKPVFSHGQLYVAISRVTNHEGLKMLMCDKNGLTNTTANVVYKEVFRNL